MKKKRERSLVTLELHGDKEDGDDGRNGEDGEGVADKDVDVCVSGKLKGRKRIRRRWTSCREIITIEGDLIKLRASAFQLDRSGSSCFQGVVERANGERSSVLMTANLVVDADGAGQDHQADETKSGKVLDLVCLTIESPEAKEHGNKGKKHHTASDPVMRDVER